MHTRSFSALCAYISLCISHHPLQKVSSLAKVGGQMGVEVKDGNEFVKTKDAQRNLLKLHSFVRRLKHNMKWEFEQEYSAWVNNITIRRYGLSNKSLAVRNGLPSYKLLVRKTTEAPKPIQVFATILGYKQWLIVRSYSWNKNIFVELFNFLLNISMNKIIFVSV